MIYSDIADQIVRIAQAAGEKILEIGPPLDITYKQDHSPVTEADAMANAYIVQQLLLLTPDIPIIAEENQEGDNRLKQGCRRFWLVDPLDGTKGFITGGSEYTVNIALVENNQPTGGVIYAPVGKRSYFTAQDGRAYKQIQSKTRELIKARSIPEEGKTVLTSTLHASGKTSQFINSQPAIAHVRPLSSSIKFCLIAEGKADLYPRFGKTMEWDTAAGHAIILAAGGTVETLDGQCLVYGKENFINPGFIVRGL
jgi:3'(2'), 5'-bisphosphate nucleotidase